MKIIGITGSSGSGKSTVAKMVAEKLNADLIVADNVVKKLQEPEEEYFKKIVNLVGKDYLNEDGNLDRRKLASLIFKDEEKRTKINELTNKYVVKEIRKQIENSENEYVVIDVPLLIESKLDKICIFTIGVVSDYDLQIERICKRDNITKEEAKERLNVQPKNNFYEKNVDYIIENNGGEDDKFLGRIRTILQKLQ